MSLCATVTYLLNTFRDGDFTTAVGSLFQFLVTHLVRIFFPNIQFKSPLAQFEATSSCPVTYYLEETDPHPTGNSIQLWSYLCLRGVAVAEHLPLGYRDFTLLLILVFQLRGLGTWETTHLSITD